MPELPEAERARGRLEFAIGRRITRVDDHDTYVCRPHPPGEIADALVGHEVASAHRRGKFLWLETVDGPVLGLHLGMAGSIVLADADGEGRRGDGEGRRGGDAGGGDGSRGGDAGDRGRDRSRWDRFALEFEDGSRLALRDKRRLGRAVLNPDFSHVGPDAAGVGRDDFRRLIGRGHSPVKARLLNQRVISGVGNLLADQALWQARIAPTRDVSGLSELELDRLRRELRAAVRSAISKGGVHTGRFIPARGRDGHCPRCGHALARDVVGGRTTYWCPVCQPG